MTVAPEFPADLTWLHVERPPRLADSLAGHVVVLYFWSAGNVHAQLLVQGLQQLELQVHGKPLALVGAHVPRAPHERGLAFVGRAARDLGIEHAVAVDDERRLWLAHGCQAWPTLVLIDASGKVRYRGAGEAVATRLARAVETLLHEADLSRVREPFRGAPAWPAESPTHLAAPAGLAHDPRRGWLWIADTSNHRVVAVDASSGDVQLVVGDGRPGAGDDTFEGATFLRPRQVRVHEDLVLVADTGNHRIRRIDLDHGIVETFAGTGRPELDLHGGSSGADQPLRAPAGMAVLDDALVVAVTGNHQVWSIALDDRRAWPIVGAGVPGGSDGALDAALLEEPVAIVADGDRLIVGEATGAVRAVDPGERELRTLHRGLAERIDGLARLPGGEIAVLDGGRAVLHVLAADGAGIAGRHELAGLAGPAGLAADAAAGTLWIADAGNDRIVQVAAGGTPQPFPLRGLRATGLRRPRRCQPIDVPRGADISLRLPLPLPVGAYVDPQSPVLVAVSSPGESVIAFDHEVEPELQGDEAVVHGLPVASGEAAEGTLEVVVRLASCHVPGGVVHRQCQRFTVPVRFDPGAAADCVLQPID